ncbi:MAG TPA: DNA cytosine methyltransferase [Pirellulaceae bacterium]|nr:DNA cytosine methyltransferase [Pirellulaceae bacterium]HMO94141.1 DNA cytosine methyltransferase [Pirellulaceae bacterium]HMP71212.1 DNA cytosine methyltransferase [Pirellulaceae bacterium]
MVKCLELFCGIGGFAAACGHPFQVVHALDINEQCLQTYSHNFPHAIRTKTLESVRPDELASYQADLWWMSPPCQPFTTRGRQRDIDDPRCAALLNLTNCLAEIQPQYLAIENVPPFETSRAAERLRTVLTQRGYEFHEWTLCPTALGIANRRRRYYLVASRSPLATASISVINQLAELGSLQHFAGATHYSNDQTMRINRRIREALVEANWSDPSLFVPQSTLNRFGSAMSIIDLDDSDAITTCFTSAYGRSPLHSGSYLRREKLVRFFCPLEIIRLLGFAMTYKFSEELTRAQSWSLAGNSLSVDVIRYLLRLFCDDSIEKLVPEPDFCEATSQKEGLKT